jgi:L-ribulose-5-phosphate 3-epimerase
MNFKYGVMQGRLSRQIGNKIQAFPEKYWKSEFSKAKKLGLNCIEWTLDYKNLQKNPIFKKKGKLEIKRLSKKYSVFIKSLTGDCFMQKPFWKLNKNTNLLEDFKKIIEAANDIGIKIIVIPLVDNGSLSKKVEVQNLFRICKNFKKYLKKTKLKIVFESDFNPKKLQKFIKKFDKKYFGINYDVGNSAALNYDVDEEFNLYGNRIYNIHIKDRIKFGKSVRLGEGNANFSKLFKNLKRIKYNKNIILQTARSKQKQHMKEININLNFLKKFHYA